MEDKNHQFLTTQSNCSYFHKDEKILSVADYINFYGALKDHAFSFIIRNIFILTNASL